MNKWRIKKGDIVEVIAGKSKGERGEITQVFRDERRVIVKGVNVAQKHQKASQSGPGKIVEKEQSIHASNVMVIDPSNDKPTRVGMKMIDGKKVRVSKRTGSVIS